MLHIPAINYHLLAAKQEPYQKAYLLTKNTEEFLGKKSGEWASRQKNERRDSKVESNDSPEIPDRRETSDVPGLLSERSGQTRVRKGRGLEFSAENPYYQNTRFCYPIRSDSLYL